MNVIQLMVQIKAHDGIFFFYQVFLIVVAYKFLFKRNGQFYKVSIVHRFCLKSKLCFEK